MYCFYEKKILLKIIIELNYLNTAQRLMTHLHNRIYPQSKKLPPYCLPFCENESMTLQIFHLKDKSEDTAIQWQSWLQHYDQEETKSCQIKGKKK